MSRLCLTHCVVQFRLGARFLPSSQSSVESFLSSLLVRFMLLFKKTQLLFILNQTLKEMLCENIFLVDYQ